MHAAQTAPGYPGAVEVWGWLEHRAGLLGLADTQQGGPSPNQAGGALGAGHDPVSSGTCAVSGEGTRSSVNLAKLGNVEGTQGFRSRRSLA